LLLLSDGDEMDIRRLQAAHSIRDLVIDTGASICGVLIALGGAWGKI